MENKLIIPSISLVKSSSSLKTISILILIRGIAQFLFGYKVIPGFLLNTISGFIFLLVVIDLAKKKTQYLFPLQLFSYWIFFFYCISSMILNGFSFKGGSDLFSYIFYYFISCYMFVQNPIDLNTEFRKFNKFFFYVLIAQLFLYLIKLGTRSNLGSLFGHANSANLYLGILIIYFLKNKSYVLSFIMFILMVLLGGRTSMISVVLIGVGILIMKPTSSTFKKSAIIIIISVISYIIFDYLLKIADLGDWGEKVSLGVNFSNDAEESRLINLDSLKWRLQNWGLYLEKINANDSLLFGNGIGSYVDVSPDFYDTFFEVHNDFLKIVYDLGLVGMFLFLFSDISLIFFVKKRSNNDIYLIVLIYVLRYSFMFFDNLVTNFMGTVMFVGSLYFIVDSSLINSLFPKRKIF